LILEKKVTYTVQGATSWIRSLQKIVSFYGATAPSRPEPPQCPGFTITLRLTTVGRTSPDKPETEKSDNEINSNMNRFNPYPANVENMVS